MISVREALRLPGLSNVVVRTGKKGVSRKIRWAHSFDYDDVKHFLEGGELLLTLGQGWPKDKELEEKLLEGFLRYQISGILFATGRYLPEIPLSVLEFGDKYAIPVLEVPFNVPFVKITHAIHIEMMNRQFRRREFASKLPLELTKKLKDNNSRKEVCQALTEYLECPVVITNSKNKVLEKVIPKGKKRIDVPGIMEHFIKIAGDELACDNEMEDVKIRAIHIQTNTPPYAIVVPLHIEGDFYGAVWLISTEKEWKNDATDILEYGADILINLVSNNQDLEVKRRQLRLEFLDLLIENSQTASIIVEEKLLEIGLEQLENWVAGMILSGDKKRSILQTKEAESICNECKQWIDETEGINGFCEMYKGQLVLLICSSLDTIKIKQEFNKLQKNLIIPNTQTSPVLVLGEIKQNVLSIAESYQEVKALAPIVQHQSHLRGAYFADQFRRELIIYGGLDPDKAQELRNLILPQELLSKKGLVLYETLKCLASLDYNRAGAAKALHIHPNTLRYRIERIEELINDSLTSKNCQFWLKIAFDLESFTNQIVVSS